jgi:hypothetical protein
MASGMQRMFNRVVRHLRKQGKPAVRNGDCLYRTPDGLSCAAGCLIPNRLYTPEYENKSMTLVLDTDEKLLKHLDRLYNVKDTKTRELLKELQIAHDRQLKSYGLESWEAVIRGLAQKFNLTIPKR